VNREKLGSRLGFILLSAGCAIGIGNVWRFPYLTGKYGGGAFVLLYLIFLVLLGIPVMTMEFAVGRGSQKSPVRMFQELEKPGSKWHIHGYVCLIGDTLLMMYYTTVAGWMLQYFVRSAAGQFNRKDTEAVGRVYQEMLHQPGMLTLSMVVIVALGFFVCSIGLQSGLERVTKVIMPLLLLIMIVLALNSMFLKNASEGLNFFLVPDFGRMKEAGIIKVIVAAMNQAFFTLSVGIGSMAIFGSYIDKKHALLGESVNVALLDTFVAITAGMIIIPACFSYDVELTEGPGLIFVTLPNIFNDMPLGRLWGGLFFVFMCFAAFSTVLALFESSLCDGTDILEPEEDEFHLRVCHDPSLTSLHAWIQCSVRFPAAGRGQYRYGPGGPDRQQFPAAGGSACFCSFLHDPCRVGMGTLCRRIQYRKRVENPFLAEALHDFCTAGHHHCGFRGRPYTVFY